MRVSPVTLAKSRTMLNIRYRRHPTLVRVHFGGKSVGSTMSTCLGVFRGGKCLWAIFMVGLRCVRDLFIMIKFDDASVNSIGWEMMWFRVVLGISIVRFLLRH